MKIKCGNCGKDILVPDDLVVGQHVRCPYCNEKTAFDKPSRVELPEGFEVKRKARTKIDELKRVRAEKVNPEESLAVAGSLEKSKPELALRRPAQETHDREHMNAAAAAVDARVRKTERDRRMAKIKKTVGNWISIAALLALLLVGYVAWQSFQKKEMPVRLPERVTQIISNAVEKVNEEVLK